MEKRIFQCYLMGVFECSTHGNYRGRRLDVIAATRHDDFAEANYQRLLNIGMWTARDKKFKTDNTNGNCKMGDTKSKAVIFIFRFPFLCVSGLKNP